MPENIDDSVLIKLSAFDARLRYLKKHFLVVELATHIPKHLHVSQYGLIGFLIATAKDIKQMLCLIVEFDEELGYFHRARPKSAENDASRSILSVEEYWQSLSLDTRSYLTSIWCRLIEVDSELFGREKSVLRLYPKAV